MISINANTVRDRYPLVKKLVAMLKPYRRQEAEVDNRRKAQTVAVKEFAERLKEK